MPPMVTAQAMAVLDLLSTERGKTRVELIMAGVTELIIHQQLRALRENANYLRKGLMELNLRVIGDTDSPVICFLLVYFRQQRL